MTRSLSRSYSTDALINRYQLGRDYNTLSYASDYYSPSRVSHSIYGEPEYGDYLYHDRHRPLLQMNHGNREQVIENLRNSNYRHSSYENNGNYGNYADYDYPYSSRNNYYGEGMNESHHPSCNYNMSRSNRSYRDLYDYDLDSNFSGPSNSSLYSMSPQSYPRSGYSLGECYLKGGGGRASYIRRDRPLAVQPFMQASKIVPITYPSSISSGMSIFGQKYRRPKWRKSTTALNRWSMW